MSEERFIDIESKIAFQEKTISELSEVIFRQQKEIDHLKEQVELLSGNLKSVTEMVSRSEDPRDEKPPHY